MKVYMQFLTRCSKTCNKHFTLYDIDNYARTVEVLFEKGTKSCYRC